MGMVFALVVAWRSGEHVPPRRWLGAAVALSGALVVLAL
jgi:drug/metabolite transporter (DMT)-like permease